MPDRFDGRFGDYSLARGGKTGDGVRNEIKAFIRSELSAALKIQKDQFIRTLEGMKVEILGDESIVIISYKKGKNEGIDAAISSLREIKPKNQKT